VRSSTPSFCRDKIDTVIRSIMDKDDKNYTIDMMAEIKKDFLKEPVERIAFPRGINDYTKYANQTGYDNGIAVPKGCPIHVRGSLYYNWLINENKLALQPIANGSRIRFVYIDPKNAVGGNVISFIGSWGPELDSRFSVDYEMQWEKSFQGVIQRFFDVVGWGKIVLVRSALDDLFPGDG